MKKLIALSFLMVALVALGAVSVSAADAPVASYGTPVFDGIMDDLYLASDELIADDRVTLRDEMNVDADPMIAQFIATASFRFMWDEEYLYCYFETKDTTPSDIYSGWFEGADGVRIYVDYYPDEEDGFDFRDEPHGFNAFLTNKAEDILNNQVTGKQLTSDGAGIWLENMVNFALKFDKNYVGPTEGSIAGEFRIAWDESMEPEAGHVLDVLCAALDDINGEDGIEYYNWYGDTTNVDLEGARKYCGAWNPLVLSSKTYTPPKVIGYGTADVKDGVMDDAYLASDVITVDALCLIDEEEYVDPVLMNVLAKAQCRLLWDEENLYVYFEVNDPTPSSFISEGYNNNDCFVMWVDFNHGGPILDYRSGKQEVDVPRAFMFEVSIVDSMNNRIFGTQLADGDMRGVWGDMVKTKMITYFNKNFEGGYAGEMIIPWAEGLTPEVGHIMGVMAGVKDDINDDDSCDYYLYSYEHDLDTYGSDYKYTNGWEHAILSDVTYVAPETPDEPTETPDEPTETPDEPTETPDEPTETPDEPTETPDEPTEQPPAQTLDAGIVVAVSVMAIAAGVVLTKKK